jgi:hypothetical protein
MQIQMYEDKDRHLQGINNTPARAAAASRDAECIGSRIRGAGPINHLEQELLGCDMPDLQLEG